MRFFRRAMPFTRPTTTALALCLALPLWAQTVQPLMTADELRAYALQQAQLAVNDPAARIEVQLGMPEAQAPVAPCLRSEPFVPAGMRLWGRASVGVRCVDGANWRVLFPVTVSVWGPAWVAASALPAGTTLSANDLRETEVELTRERTGLPRGTEALLGKVLVRPLQAGQPLHADVVRAATVVTAGDVVRLRVLGGGFAITASGQSLGTAGRRPAGACAHRLWPHRDRRGARRPDCGPAALKGSQRHTTAQEFGPLRAGNPTVCPSHAEKSS